MTLFNPKAGLMSAGIIGCAIGLAAPVQADTGAISGLEVLPNIPVETLADSITHSLISSSFISSAEQSRRDRLQHLQSTVAPSRLASSPLAQAQQQHRLTSQQAAESALPRPTSLTETSRNSAEISTADGTYLYGQQPLPNQPATAYFVFEAQAGNVTGAFYMTSSSFDCVQGQLTARRMSLQVTDSYTQETHAYAVSLNPSVSEVASIEEGTSLANAAAPDIEGYYSLPVSDRDLEILSTCQAQF